MAIMEIEAKTAKYLQASELSLKLPLTLLSTEETDINTD
jgi:hypothetical protein